MTLIFFLIAENFLKDFRELPKNNLRIFPHDILFCETELCACYAYDHAMSRAGAANDQPPMTS